MICTGNRRFALLAAVAMLCTALLWAAPAQAYYSDAALERDGTLCTHQVTRAERKYGIPQRLLAAIAATETGQYHKGLGVKIPWPWVINVEGKPFFFDNKREAVAAVEKFQRQGKTSIDVGCMQINLKHHPQAFTNLNQAFEPRYNVDYAARFLRGHYDDTRTWKTAVGRYHSRTPGFAARYIGLVYNNWYGLAAKGSTAHAAAAPRTPAKRYTSYVQMEGGEQVVFSKGAKHPTRKVVARSAKDENVIRSASREPVRNDFQLSIIRPASAAGKVETAPTQSSESIASPLVLTMGEAKSFTTPKVMSISAKGKTDTSGEDSRFIRFVD